MVGAGFAVAGGTSYPIRKSKETPVASARDFTRSGPGVFLPERYWLIAALEAVPFNLWMNCENYESISPISGTV